MSLETTAGHFTGAAQEEETDGKKVTVSLSQMKREEKRRERREEKRREEKRREEKRREEKRREEKRREEKSLPWQA